MYLFLDMIKIHIVEIQMIEMNPNILQSSLYKKY